VSTFHMDEYDEQGLIDSGKWKLTICETIVWSNDIGQKWITIIINDIPEWRRVFISKEGSYIQIGTNKHFIS
jgi:hypothetical protein